MAKQKNLVGQAKGLLTITIVFIMVFGWILALAAISEDVIKEQNALIASARKYAEEELYVKAVAQYKKAVSTYDTENTLAYEAELLSVYKKAGMLDEYYSLIDSRLDAGTASAEEYIERAEQYIRRGGEPSAIKLLQQGQTVYADSVEITTLYESISYEYTLNSSTCAELRYPNADWYIPAYDGEKWGYIGTKGKTVLNFNYDEATRFSNGYAVVKSDGVYMTIDKKGYKNSIDKNGLDSVTAIANNRIVGVKDGRSRVYDLDFNPLGEDSFDSVYVNENGRIVVKKDGKWAILDANMKEVTGYIFTDVAVNSCGQVFNGVRAVVADERGYFLINADGEAYYDTRFANARGFEGGYYAVADDSGKWGFAGLEGELIVEYQYDDAKSFSNRLAAVKIGDEWGYINRYGTVSIEPQFKDAMPFLEGISLAKDNDGTYKIIALKYYSLF